MNDEQVIRRNIRTYLKKNSNKKGIENWYDAVQLFAELSELGKDA